MTDHGLLQRAAERASGRGFFLASLLLPYARAEGLANDELAEILGCKPADLPLVLLCRRPYSQGLAFRADVERIAERFGVDPSPLAATIRLAEALEALRKPSAGELQAAARDRDEEADAT